ncbi:MlaD family protein [Mycolicibacterium vaccae]|uniref:MlaD family protein n=1 Tax=Mycolicibacterium vaccae TaxID=1810 RepID=UPI003CFDB49B
MGNRFELDGRGPSDRALVATCVAFVLTCTVVVALMYAKSTGSLDPRVQVVASLPSVGDGLPPKSDVKYRGVLVGMVRSVNPALHGEDNVVDIDLWPQHADHIPATITARIVPGNAFAVSTVQLVDNGTGPPIRSGAVIRQDHTLPTQLFQSTLTKVRQLVDAVGRPESDHTLGVLRTISDATAGKGPELTAAAAGLNRIVDEMNTLRTDGSGPPALQTWTDAVTALGSTAPELLDSLRNAVTPMRTVAEQHTALADLLTGAGHTVGTMRTALDNHTDTLVNITTNLTPVLGVLSDRSAKFPAIAVGINNVVDKFFGELWTRTGQKVTFTFKLVVALAPLRLYTRADCPVYGELRGPSCETAPLTTEPVDTRGLPDPRSYVPPQGIELPEPTNTADEVIMGALRTPAEQEQFLPGGPR